MLSVRRICPRVVSQGHKAVANYVTSRAEENNALGAVASETLNENFFRKPSLLEGPQCKVSQHAYLLIRPVMTHSMDEARFHVAADTVTLGPCCPLVAMDFQASLQLIYEDNSKRGVARPVGFSALRIIREEPELCRLPSGPGPKAFGLIEALYVEQKQEGKGLGTGALYRSLCWAKDKTRAVTGQISDRNIGSFKSNIKAGHAAGWAYVVMAHHDGRYGAFGRMDHRGKVWEGMFDNMTW